MIANRVTTLEQAQIVRQIRNSGRKQMTRYTLEITEDQQEQWFNSLAGDTQLYLYYDHGKVIGFGMIKIDMSGWTWATLAVLPEYRGRGYGTMIYQHLAASVDCDLWIEIRLNNMASFEAAKKAGFTTHSIGNVITMVYIKGNL